MAGKKTGFLTEPRREYLKLPQKKRRQTYSESQRNQFDDAIREQAQSALDDLILIAQKYDDEGLQTVFSKDAIEELVGSLMDRIGLDDAEGNGRYYDIFLKTIEQKIHQKYRNRTGFSSSNQPIIPLCPVNRHTAMLKHI